MNFLMYVNLIWSEFNFGESVWRWGWNNCVGVRWHKGLVLIILQIKYLLIRSIKTHKNPNNNAVNGLGENQFRLNELSRLFGKNLLSAKWHGNHDNFTHKFDKPNNNRKIFTITRKIDIYFHRKATFDTW